MSKKLERYGYIVVMSCVISAPREEVARRVGKRMVREMSKIYKNELAEGTIMHCDEVYKAI